VGTHRVLLSSNPPVNAPRIRDPKMDLPPAWLCARECLDCALQRAVRPRCTRHVT